MVLVSFQTDGSDIASYVDDKTRSVCCNETSKIFPKYCLNGLKKSNPDNVIYL